MLRRLVVVLGVALLGLPACAALAPRVQGTGRSVAWRAEDFELVRRPVGGRDVWSYAFSLVIEETRGRSLTFTRIDTTVYQPNTSPWTPTYRGIWPLPAKGAFRIPLSSGLRCPSTVDACLGPTVPIPLWQIVLTGVDEAGQTVREVVDLRLPPDPPLPVTRRAHAIPPISLTSSTPAPTPRPSPSVVPAAPAPPTAAASTVTPGSYYRMPQLPTATRTSRWCSSST